MAVLANQNNVSEKNLNMSFWISQIVKDVSIII